MAKFDPKKAREEGNQGIPAGEYLLAFVKVYEVKTSKRDRPYATARIAVIAGAAKGKTFREIVSLDTTNGGTCQRLGLLFDSVGWAEPIEELEDVDELRKILLRKPFKAKVSRKNENGYWNNGIERFVLGDGVTERDRDAMEAWVIEEEARRDMEGDSDGSGAGQYDDDAPPPDDQDIPF